MSQPRGDWAGVTSSCLWRVSPWFSGMSTVYLRELSIQLPITTTNARSKSTYEGKSWSHGSEFCRFQHLVGWLRCFGAYYQATHHVCQACVAGTAANLKKDIAKEGRPGLQHGRQRRILCDLTTTAHRCRNRSRLTGGFDEHSMSKS